MPPAKAVIQSRARNALALAFVSDALSMPVHWFYDPTSITQAFGPQGVQSFEAPPSKHPYTFMSRPKPEANGKQIIGDVIHKGLEKHWGPENHHVHATLSAGANTLNAQVARVVSLAQYEKKHVDRKHGFNVDRYVSDYIQFMTAFPPNGPKDCYAEGFHRAFFSKYNAGVTAASCADTGSGAESIGALTATIPTILLELARDGNIARVVALAQDQVSRTHRRARLNEVVSLYVQLVGALLFRDSDEDVPSVVAKAYAETQQNNGAAPPLSQLLSKGSAKNVIGIDGQPIKSSCDVAESVPAILYLTLKYRGNVAEGILAGVNVGGENCHRGFALGPLLALTSDAAAEKAVKIFGPGLADAKLLTTLDEVTKAVVE